MESPSAWGVHVSSTARVEVGDRPPMVLSAARTSAGVLMAGSDHAPDAATTSVTTRYSSTSSERSDRRARRTPRPRTLVSVSSLKCARSTSAMDPNSLSASSGELQPRVAVSAYAMHSGWRISASTTSWASACRPRALPVSALSASASRSRFRRAPPTRSTPTCSLATVVGSASACCEAALREDAVNMTMATIAMVEASVAAVVDSGSDT
mmetsp:Transcript_36502/g.92178  ORF Transcript_36502/g.92178 Transcript_36502/m.92178 type:complete len:210 (-) Transcript_36502:554-1183(-)